MKTLKSFKAIVLALIATPALFLTSCSPSDNDQAVRMPGGAPAMPPGEIVYGCAPGFAPGGPTMSIYEYVERNGGRTEGRPMLPTTRRPESHPASFGGGRPSGEMKTVQRDTVVRFEEWNDPKTGQLIKKQSIVPAGTPPRMKGRLIPTEAGDGFVNSPDGKSDLRPQGREVSPEILEAVARRQARVPR